MLLLNVKGGVSPVKDDKRFLSKSTLDDNNNIMTTTIPTRIVMVVDTSTEIASIAVRA